jgi:FKBP-type peptidyl-prolyl cis-trans isomerase FkpA
MRRTALLLPLLLAAAVGCSKAPGGGSQTAQPTPDPLGTEDDKAMYALGVAMGRNLAPLRLSPAEMERVKMGLEDAASGAKMRVENVESYGPKIQALAQARAQEASQAEKSRSLGFAEGQSKEPGAVRTGSGLVYRTLKPGSGPSPKADSTVRVHYVGRLIDGKEFDSSRQRGEPVEFALNQVIPCWTEGVQRMKVGETAQLVCPSDIAYGDQGRPPVIPGGATLVFEVELLAVK